jgi:Lrp/AsnC family transcriptional regulator for asnA, asnC and gidA
MLDDIDRTIIAYLQYDGRTPYTQIAEEIEITETTVRRRVKRLIDEGLMQIVAVVEPQNMGIEEAAMIGISVQANLISSIADEIAQLPEVTYLFQAAGEYDLIAEVFCKDRDHFVSFLNDKLQQIDGIERTQSFMILKLHKLSYRWGEAKPPVFSNNWSELNNLNQDETHQS